MLVSVLVFVVLVRAEEITSQPKPSNPSPAEITLPRCIDNDKQLHRITEHVNANKKNPSKYSEYRAVLNGALDEEVVARLAYAETKGARCPLQNLSIGPRIVEVIANRVKKRGGDVRSVVFQRDQFASSLNIYSNSRYRDFLCPRDLDLWKALVLAVRSSLPNSPSHVRSDTMNYFLYKHDPRWTQPPWSFTEDPAGQSEEARACVRFFRVPDWK